MGKLIFCYGAMGASKSAELLMWRYNYEQSGYAVLLLKPKIDNREKHLSDKMGIISSRIGLTAECLLIDETIAEWKNEIDTYDIIMIDEAQFLTENQVDELYQISMRKTVICFGLRTDFTQHFFPGSKRLMELATDIRELKTVCKCGKKATINARFDGEKLMTEGEQIQIGANESYRAMCKDCFEKLKKQPKEEVILTKKEIENGFKTYLININDSVYKEEVILTKKEIENGFKTYLININDSVYGCIGICCQIGENAFYFLDSEEDSLSISNYWEIYSLEETVDMIWKILKNETTAEEHGIYDFEYEYYVDVLKGVLTV